MQRQHWLMLYLLVGLAVYGLPAYTEENTPDTLQRMIVDLQTGRVDARITAATKLGQLGNADALPALIAALASNEPRVVCAAAAALGRFHAPQAISALVAVSKRYRGNADVVTATMNALTGAADPVLKDPMLEIATDTTAPPLHRVLALDVLESLHDPTIGPNLLPLLRPNKKDGTYESVAARAALLAGRLGVKEAAPAIRKLLLADQLHTCYNAVLALGYLADPASVQPLTEVAQHVLPVMRVAALDALAAMRRPELLPTFQMALQDADATVRAHAVAGIAGCGNAAAMDSLLKALTDTHPAVRVAVADGLARYPAAYMQIVPLLADANPDYRAAAALAAGALDRAEAVPALIRLLSDADATVQHNAMAALVRMRAVDDVLPLLQAPQPTLRARAAEALGRMSTVKSLATLTTMQNNPDPSVRLWALAAIPKPTPAMIHQALADSDPDIRCTAARMAAEHNEQSAIRPLINLLSNGTPRERIAAYHSLCNLTGNDQGITPDRWDTWARQHGM